MLNDEKAYPDPSTFKPERFIRDGKLDPSVQDPEVAAFGYGRRIWCVVRFYVSRSMPGADTVLALVKISQRHRSG